MDSLTHVIRLVAGLSMVAAGTTLTAPTGIYLATYLRQQGKPAVSTPLSPAPLQVTEAPVWPPVADIPLPPPAMASGPRLAYVPPPTPPQPLPPPPPALAAVGPDLAAGYRPTLQAPPPPLLDGQAPPPLAVGWTARQPGAFTGGGWPQPPQVMAEQPGIYIVRDGDDLTSIATRFYGHPAAAEAIWHANRGLLRDPGVLPIGAALVLPPRAVVAGLGMPPNQAVIEPVTSGQPHFPPHQAGPTPRPASWLSGEGATGGARLLP